jgi:beta-glucosidase
VPYFVDATDLFDTDDPAFEEEARRRQDIVFLALDLVSGRIDEHHSLWSWLLKNGARETDLAYFLDNAVALPVIGMNLYPMFTQKKLLRDTSGRFRIRMPYAGADLISRLGRLYYERYRAPLMISETASMGSLRRRLDWLDASVMATRELREEGIPLVGYTWWPMFALVTWAYRQGRRPVTDHLAQMGLWDIVPDETDPLRRVRTSAVDTYQRLVRSGTESIGMLSEIPFRAAARL